MKNPRLVLGALVVTTLMLVAVWTWSDIRPGSARPPSTPSLGDKRDDSATLDQQRTGITRTAGAPAEVDPRNPSGNSSQDPDSVRFVFEGQVLQIMGPGEAPDWSRLKSSVLFQHGPHSAEILWATTTHVDPLGSLRIELSEFRPLTANWRTLDCFKRFTKHPEAAFQFKLDHPLFETVERSLPAQPWPAMEPGQVFTWQLGTLELTAAAGFTGLVQGPASEQGKPCRIGLLAKEPDGLPAPSPVLQIDGQIGEEFYLRAPKLGAYYIAAAASGLRPAVTTGECLPHRMVRLPLLELRRGASIIGKVRDASPSRPMEVVAEVTHDDFRLALPGGSYRGFATVYWDQQMLGWREGMLERTRTYAKAAEDGSFEISGLAPMGHRVRALMFNSRRENVAYHLSEFADWPVRVVPPADGVDLLCTTSRIEIVGVAGERTLTDRDLWDGMLRIRPASYRSGMAELGLELTFPYQRVFQSESHSTFDVDVHWGGKLITTLQLSTGAPLETSRWVLDFRKLGVVQ